MIYNTYRIVDQDPFLATAGEDLFLVFFSAFITGWGIVDDLARRQPAALGVDVLVVSSASAKTAFLTAFYWKQRFPDLKVIGLSRPTSTLFSRSLNVYDLV